VIGAAARAELQPTQANSLWMSGSRTFFRDPRASKIGDLITVQIDYRRSGQDRQHHDALDECERKRQCDESFRLGKPPQGHSSRCRGSLQPSKTLGRIPPTREPVPVDRSETINLTVAAVVTQVLPNGNLVIQGIRSAREQ
jgi:flagellar L-ring protein precursor FlgH